jgi:hypothetical protein
MVELTEQSRFCSFTWGQKQTQLLKFCVSLTEMKTIQMSNIHVSWTAVLLCKCPTYMSVELLCCYVNVQHTCQLDCCVMFPISGRIQLFKIIEILNDCYTCIGLEGMDWCITAVSQHLDFILMALPEPTDCQHAVL